MADVGARFRTMRFGIVAWAFRFSDIEFQSTLHRFSLSRLGN